MILAASGGASFGIKAFCGGEALDVSREPDLRRAAAHLLFDGIE
jgi:hypothetical protein